MAIMASCITWLNLSQELNYDASKKLYATKTFQLFSQITNITSKKFLHYSNLTEYRNDIISSIWFNS